MVGMLFGCCRSGGELGVQIPDSSSHFPQVSACQHPLSQSYLSSCLFLRALGSNHTALVLTCHINQQCCNEWVGFTAQSCAQLGWGSGLFSPGQGTAGEQGWVRTNSCHGCTVSGSSGVAAGTLFCLGPRHQPASPPDIPLMLLLPSSDGGQGLGPSTSLQNQAPKLSHSY